MAEELVRKISLGGAQSVDTVTFPSVLTLCHFRGDGNPALIYYCYQTWIPAFAGMTNISPMYSPKPALSTAWARRATYG